ncbi:MAG: YIP1 family protein [Firmicutes bacterium]|nr:YIP1 family protein [Bacillota bacterium]
MNILDLLDGVVWKPVSTLNLIAREKPVGWALSIFALSTLLGLVSTDYSVFEPLQISPTLFIIIQIVVSIAGLFVFAGLLHLVAPLFKGHKDYWGLFSALGFANFPGFLSPVAAVLGNTAGMAGAILGGVISVAAGIWMLVLYLIALRENCRISTGASILTYLVALIVVVLAVMVIFFLLVLKMR